MQIKHTFLFTLILGLAWTGYLFAYILGPDPAMNGIFGSTCTLSGCHTGNPENDGVGSVNITGLPSDGWTPGQVYPLMVTIQRTGARLFGFELSAVADTTNQQAGTLTAGSSRVRVICGRGTAPGDVQINCSTAGAIQYAEHSNAQVVTSSYPVNWTAPSSASVGTVRFNVAGNAANGDITNQGDFIYTRVFKVDPASAGPPPPPPPDLSTRAFSLVNLGGTSVITDGSGDLSVGYSRIQPGSGSTTPSGVAIFGLRQNNVLISEAGVPASVRLTSARVYAEFSLNTVNTGVAIANPNDQPATINFHFTDGTGATFGDSSFTLLPNQQMAKFVDQDPFNLNRSSFQGTLSFTSNVEVSVIALRGFLNERTPSEFLITTLPVTNLSAVPGTGPVYLAHFAAGGGWTTQVVLVNPSEATITGTIQFFGPGSDSAAGAPLTVATTSGAPATSFNYTIPKQSSFKLVTAASPVLLIGSVRVTPTAGASPSSLIVFSFKPATITVSEAGVPGIQGSAFRMYAEETSAAAVVGAIQTGFAIANLGSTPANVTLELTTLDGTAVSSVPVTVPANGQIAGFLHDKFPGLAFPFKGLLRISGGGAAGLSVVGLRGRYNERGDFLTTTTPPNNESNPASAAELLFPHIINGGGYTTQFILFSGTAGQASSGNLKFSKQDGTALNLTLN
jgi:hypothetical protein